MSTGGAELVASKEQIEGIRREIVESSDKLSIAVDHRARALLTSRSNKALYDGLLSERNGKLVCIGPGGSFHPAWCTVDKSYSGGLLWSEMVGRPRPADPDILWDALDLLPLPISENTAQCVYCSHVLEHLTVKSVENAILEFHRILLPGGVLRIVCPDYELAASAYDRGDWYFFLEHAALEARVASGALYSNDLSDEESRRGYSAFELLRSFSLICDSRNSFNIHRAEAINFIERFVNARDAVEAACALSDVELNRVIGRHISCWSYRKLDALLRKSGFKDVFQSSFLQSTSPLMRHRHFFDKTDPHNSFYIEAIKA